MKWLLLVLMAVALLMGCTEQSMARNYGGDTVIKLPCGRKLVTGSWKVDNLWLLTRPMHEAEDPGEYVYMESSSWGVWEGTITIKECRD